MHKTNGERWGAATGYVVFLLGIGGAAFERGAPVDYLLMVVWLLATTTVIVVRNAKQMRTTLSLQGR